MWTDHRRIPSLHLTYRSLLFGSIGSCSRAQSASVAKFLHRHHSLANVNGNGLPVIMLPSWSVVWQDFIHFWLTLGLSVITAATEDMFSSLFVCLTVGKFAPKTSERICMKFFREGWQWAKEQLIKVSWKCRTDSLDGGAHIATMVRRALAEVCTVPVLLVADYIWMRIV